MSLELKITNWGKEYGFINWSKEIDQKVRSFFPKTAFTLISFGEHVPNRKLGKYRRLLVGKPLKDNPNVIGGATVVLTKISEIEYSMDFKAGEVVIQQQPKPALHEKIINKWIEEQKTRFGFLKPEISTPANLNEILPESIRLKENVKSVDGSAVLKIGELSIYKSVIEVQHKGVKEDTVVRLALIIPFIDHVDLVADIDDLTKMKELLERLVDPNIVKARVSFSTFTEYMKLK